MDTPALLRILRREFRLDWHGIHGAAHWARVRANGRALAALTGARVDVVEAFAWVHDSQRHDDGRDPAHGLRAARWAETVNDTLLFLDGDGLALLTSAAGSGAYRHTARPAPLVHGAGGLRSGAAGVGVPAQQAHPVPLGGVGSRGCGRRRARWRSACRLENPAMET
ncbi:MAG: hypothetical protein NTZ79_13050 [Proteobacteria bacterium]|nr:hypothetical protein [Pseudomonadota bacterium]